MEKWEYYVVYLTWDSDKKQWTDGNTPGLAQALDVQGAKGWELVSVDAAGWTGWGVDANVDKWGAFFKRRKQ